jgi:hypothetical protein
VLALFSSARIDHNLYIVKLQVLMLIYRVISPHHSLPSFSSRINFCHRFAMANW